MIMHIARWPISNCILRYALAWITELVQYILKPQCFCVCAGSIYHNTYFVSFHELGLFTIPHISNVTRSRPATVRIYVPEEHFMNIAVFPPRPIVAEESHRYCRDLGKQPYGIRQTMIRNKRSSCSCARKSNNNGRRWQEKPIVEASGPIFRHTSADIFNVRKTT